jgi:hypothetical protein
MSTIFPLSASVNQEFDGYRFNGTSWDIIGQEYNPTVYSGSEPSGAKAGDIWIDSSTDVPSISPETILTINAASATYLTKNSASTTYLSQSNASANYATKAYADNSSSVAAAALVDAAPSTLNTLNELAAALGDDANFATTVTTALGNKLDISSASSTYLTQASASSTYASKINPRPNFLVYFSGGNGTVSNGATLSYNSELYDDLNNVSSGIFTVPSGHAGTYSFVVNANCYNIGSGNWRVNIETTGSNSVAYAGGFSPALGGTDTFANAHSIIKLAEGDTVRVKWVVPATGLYSAGINYNSFSGARIF